MSKPDDTSGLPAWFDETRHSAGNGGIFETATNTLLGDDGQPHSQAVRLARAAAAVAAEPVAEPEVAVPVKAARRDTTAILAAHAAAEPKE